MIVLASIFWDFNLPNATTWFFFSGLLAMGFFFKFSRLFCMRNLDVAALFLLVPGLLLLQEARSQPTPAEKEQVLTVTSVVAACSTQIGSPPLTGLGNLARLNRLGPSWTSARLRWYGYLWLLCGSGAFFFRCLLDLALVQRPALAPNLNFGGLAWLAGAMFVCLATVAYRLPEGSAQKAAKDSVQQPPTRGSKVLELAQRPFEETFLLQRTLAVVCHFLVALGLIVVGVRHFQDPAAGMAAAAFYLLLPYTGFYVGQVVHVWPMAVVIWAVVAYPWPLLAGALLGLAAGTIYFPALILPVWISFYWRRGLGRFLFAALFTAALCLVMAWLGDEDPANTVREALNWSAWQPWKVPTTEGFWTGVHWAYRIPVFIAYCAFLLTTFCWPAPKNLAHLLALSAAILIGLQFWYADQGGIFVLWYLPLLLLLTFRPNLSDHRATPLDQDWLTRIIQFLGRLLGRLLGRQPSSPEPVRR